MSSKNLEQLIEQIEIYIDNCPAAGVFGGGSTIKVNREEILDMLYELKAQLPREIDQSREIVRSQDARIAKATAEAERIVNNAAQEAEKMIDENEIVNMANMRAQEIVDDAADEANDILNDASQRSFDIQSGALQYTQNVLAGLEDMYKSMVDQETAYFNAVLDKLRDDYRQVMEDKREVDFQLGNGLKSARKKEDFEKKED